jgi:hypothetical protein
MSSSSVTDNIWHQTERAEQRDAPTPVTVKPPVTMSLIILSTRCAHGGQSSMNTATTQPVNERLQMLSVPMGKNVVYTAPEFNQ